MQSNSFVSDKNRTKLNVIDLRGQNENTKRNGIRGQAEKKKKLKKFV